MYYRLNRDQDASEIVTQALNWIVNSVSNEPVIKADREKLERMLSVAFETACAR
jgi:ArsR family transcriptional regulator